MALVDERGRVLGRVNLIDLLVGAFCLLLIPLAYGAFVLFRTPPPSITSVTPGTVLVGSKARVTVTGSGLRPFLAANVGSTRADFYVASQTKAEVAVPDLPVGTYDLYLSDDSLLVATAVGAITIVPPPPPPTMALQVSGEFTGISEAVARTLTAGARFPAGAGDPAVEVMAVRPAAPLVMQLPTATGALQQPMPGMVRMPAVLRIRCSPEGHTCKVGNVSVAAGATIIVPVGAAASFQILDVSVADRSPLFDPNEFTQTMEIDARFVTSPETLSLLSSGAVDQDRQLFVRDPGGTPAVLRSFRRVGDADGRSAMDWVGGDIKTAHSVLNVPRPLTVIDATLVVPVGRTAEGWQYKGVGIKVGGPLSFEGPMYTLRGWILNVKSKKP